MCQRRLFNLFVAKKVLKQLKCSGLCVRCELGKNVISFSSCIVCDRLLTSFVKFVFIVSQSEFFV